MTNRREFLVGATCLGVAVAATHGAADGGSEVSPPREKDLGKAKSLPSGRYDECMAVFGKIRDSRWRLRDVRTNKPNEEVPAMFIDTTPGPKQIWRKEALQKLYLTQFKNPIKDRLMFGTDNNVRSYRVQHCREYQDFDDALFREMELTDEQVDSYYRKALESFLFG